MAKKEHKKRKSMRVHDEQVASYTTEDLMKFMEQLRANDEAAFRRDVNLERLFENLILWKFGEDGINEFGRFLEELKNSPEPGTEEAPKKEEIK